MTAIKAIFFDVGGVLFSTNYKEVSRRFKEKFGFSPLLFSEYPPEISKKYDQKISDGRSSYKEALFDVGHVKAKDRKRVYKFYKKIYIESQTFNREVITLINNLSLIYPVYGLTNTVDLPLQINRESGAFSIFKKVYGSCEIGFRKPNKEAFLFPLKELNLKPDEVIFIDDSLENIKVAKTLGIKSILFEDCNQLKQELKNLKILK